MRNILRKSSWKFQDARSNKEYHFQLIETEAGHIVEFQYGAIGGNLKSDTKTPTPVTLAEATKIFDGMTKERLKKQYVGGETDAESGFSMTPAQVVKEIVLLPQLLNEIQDPYIVINDDRYVMQEKHNGQRRTVIRNKDGITGGNKLGTAVPLSDVLIKALPQHEFEIDCEIIGDKLFVFDLLSWHGMSLKGDGFKERVLALASNHTLTFNKNIILSKPAFTKAEKLAMFNELKAREAEGFVGKDKDGEYKAGRPNSGGDQLKFKWYKTASFIVANHTKGKRSVGLELIDENGNRTSVGKATIPPNKDMPAIGAVVEVEYLYAHKGTNAIFQSKYLKPRTVVSIAECKLTQLVYKEELAGDDDDE
jgi:bifunctional non-homologous end joining protein LigD